MPGAEFHISIHVPIAGNDLTADVESLDVNAFQSTFPLQGTTQVLRQMGLYIHISIHVPIAGNDAHRMMT